MNKNVIFPWEADPDLPEVVWANGCLTTRDFGTMARRQLTGIDMSRARAIATALVQYNFWTVCLSSSPYYMRTLYPAIAAAWMFSRRDTADIMDADALVKGAFAFDQEEKEQFKIKIIESGLLILPYIDPTYMGIKKVRGVLSTLLMSRKMQNRPVLTDLKLTRKPSGAAEAAKEVSQLQDVLGEASLSLFHGKQAKYYIISNK